MSLAAPLAIFAVIAVIIGATFLAQRGWQADAAPGPVDAEVWRAERQADIDRFAVGDRRAPVELVVYSDYQCPFCAHWDRDTLPNLVPYVDAGQLRIVWRNANLSGDASRLGSQAAYAAALQGALLPFHNALAQHDRGAAAADLSEDALIALADELELDTARFLADMTSPEAQRTVSENEAAAQRAGVVSTPSFHFNDVFVSGLKPSEVFIDQLEAALSETDPLSTTE